MVRQWEWLMIACFIVFLVIVMWCCRIYTVQEPLTVDTEMSAFDVHIQEIQRMKPAAKVDLPPSYEEATGVGLRQRTSREENLTPEDIINAGRNEPDAQGSSRDAVGGAGPSGVDRSKTKNKDKIAEV